MFALALEVAAFVELWWAVNLLSAVLAVSATLFYVFVYTLWLKRTSAQNIVIGGAAGAVPVLVGWAAVTDSLGWAPVVLFAVIFVWTPPHFWALAVRYRDDYEAAHVPMLPVVATLPHRQSDPDLHGGAGGPDACCSPRWGTWARSTWRRPLVLGAVFLAYAVRLRRQESPQGRHAMFQLLDHVPHPAVRRHGGRRAPAVPLTLGWC